MNLLFTSAKIGQLEIPNRFVRSATYDGGADKGGFISEWQIKFFRALAEGGIGLIVTGITNVDQAGKISPRQSSIADDQYIPGLKRLAEVVHRNGSKLAVQLFHGGREAFHLQQHIGREALAPSGFKAGEDRYFEGSCRQMTEEEIWTTIDAFGQAARRVQEAGCDAIQVHGAHAYLLAEFLSPQSNRRHDHWGGGLKNRLRLHLELYRAIRKQVGPNYPLMIKLGVADGFPDGLEFAEGLEAAIQLAAEGYDSIEVSQGLRGHGYGEMEARDKILTREREAYFLDWTREIKKRVNVPVMAVGGFRSLDLMEEVIASGEADFISLCRPLIREPDLLVSWQADRSRRAQCVSCNKCWDHILTGGRLQCMVPTKSKESNINSPMASPRLC